MFDDLIAENWRFNATIAQGDVLLAELAAAGYANCFTAANQISAGAPAAMIPEKPMPDTFGAPWVDPGNDLTSLGVPVNLPIYLQVWVPKDPNGKPLANWYCVAGVLRDTKNGASLKAALT